MRRKIGQVLEEDRRERQQDRLRSPRARLVSRRCLDLSRRYLSHARRGHAINRHLFNIRARRCECARIVLVTGATMAGVMVMATTAATTITMVVTTTAGEIIIP